MPVLSVPIRGIDLARTLGVHVLAGDPTTRRSPGRFERATLTPDGPGALTVTWSPGAPSARIEAYGDGASWLLDRSPGLLGCEDRAEDFEPREPVRSLWLRHKGLRIPRTGTLWHDLQCLVVQQRINGLDAAAQWRRLVRALGSAAPGPAGLMVPPPPQAYAALGYSDLHRFGIERGRAVTVLRAAHVADRLHNLVDRPSAEATPALRAIHGIGTWTASSLAALTWGERDAVILGDYGIPSMVAWALAGEHRADDERLLELLEPYRPHRYRVIRLAALAGGAPRRFPRGRRTDIRAL